MASLPASPSSWTDPWTSTRAFASRAPAPSPSRGSRPSPGTSTSARAVARDRALPTHLASLLSSAETLARHSLRRLELNERSRSDLAAELALARAAAERGPSVALASPAQRDAARSASDAKVLAVSARLGAAEKEGDALEARLREVERNAESLRQAPRESRAILGLLGPILEDLDALDALELEDASDRGPPEPAGSSPPDGGEASSRAPLAAAAFDAARRAAIQSAAAVLSEAEIDPGGIRAATTGPGAPFPREGSLARPPTDDRRKPSSFPSTTMTSARAAEIARAAMALADDLLTRAQETLEEEAQTRALLTRAKEARRLNADPLRPFSAKRRRRARRPGPGPGPGPPTRAPPPRSEARRARRLPRVAIILTLIRARE